MYASPVSDCRQLAAATSEQRQYRLHLSQSYGKNWTTSRYENAYARTHGRTSPQDGRQNLMYENSTDPHRHCPISLASTSILRTFETNRRPPSDLISLCQIVTSKFKRKSKAEKDTSRRQVVWRKCQHSLNWIVIIWRVSSQQRHKRTEVSIKHSTVHCCER